MDVPHALTASCPINVSPPRSCRFSPFSHDLDSSPQQRTRHTPPLPHPSFRGRGTPAPLLSSARVFSCLSPAVVRPSRSSLQTRRREDRSPVSSFTRHGLCIPPFPLAPHESSSPKQKMPPGSAAFSRRLVFPSLPCVHVPRPPCAGSASSLHPPVKTPTTSGMPSSRCISIPYAKGPPA